MGRTQPAGDSTAFGPAQCLAVAVLLMQGPAVLAQQQHSIPLFNPAGSVQQGFLRIINRSERAGTVRIHAVDDSGERFGPVDLSLGAMATAHLNSMDLEAGNPGRGLSAGIGDGEGDWRLELSTDLDIEPLAYARSSEGFVTTSVHDVVQPEYVPNHALPDSGTPILYHVRFFNPGKNCQPGEPAAPDQCLGHRNARDHHGTGRCGRLAARRRREGHLAGLCGPHHHRSAARGRRCRPRGQFRQGNREVAVVHPRRRNALRISPVPYRW